MYRPPAHTRCLTCLTCVGDEGSQTGEYEWEKRAHRGSATCLAADPYTTQVYTAGQDCRVRRFTAGVTSPHQPSLVAPFHTHLRYPPRGEQGMRTPGFHSTLDPPESMRVLGSFVFVRTVGAVDAVQAKVSCGTAVLCIVVCKRPAGDGVGSHGVMHQRNHHDMHMVFRFALPPELRPSGEMCVTCLPRQREPAELITVGLTLDCGILNFNVGCSGGVVAFSVRRHSSGCDVRAAASEVAERRGVAPVLPPPPWSRAAFRGRTWGCGRLLVLPRRSVH